MSFSVMLAPSTNVTSYLLIDPYLNDLKQRNFMAVSINSQYITSFSYCSRANE